MQGALDEVRKFLKQEAEDLAAVKQFQRFDSTINLPERIMEIFDESMASEREQYLGRLVQEYDDIMAQKAQAEKKLLRLKQEMQAETEQAVSENRRLQEKYKTLKAKMEDLEWRQAKKEKLYQEKLQKKQRMLGSLKSVLGQARTGKEQLKEDMGQLKQEAVKMVEKQQQMLKDAQKKCQAYLQKSIEDNQRGIQKKQTRRLTELGVQLDKAKSEYTALEAKVGGLMTALKGMETPSCPMPSIDPLTVPEHMDEIREYVKLATEDHKRIAVSKIQDEIEEIIPGLDRSQNLNDAVDSLLQQKIDEKEQECRRLIEKEKLREKRLHEKLDEALSRIQALESSRGNDLTQIEDLEAMSKKGGMLSLALDNTMQRLKQGSGLQE